MTALLRAFHPYSPFIQAPRQRVRFLCGAVVAVMGCALLLGQLFARLTLPDVAFIPFFSLSPALQGGLLAAGAMLHTVRHDLLPGALHGPQRLQAVAAFGAGALCLCLVP